MVRVDWCLAALPLVPVVVQLVPMLDDPVATVSKWAETSSWTTSSAEASPPSVGWQLWAYALMAVVGFVITNHLVPEIKKYTLRKGISGKDLGKKGTDFEDNLVPEALGIVPGAVFLVCLIFCLVGFATSNPSKMLDVNSALLSVCFMLFLGFTDDVLDWPWRYKLVLPSVASLPLLCCYNGSTSVVVPMQLRSLLWTDGQATWFGDLLNMLVVVDAKADGSLIDLGPFYMLYMGMLAVFCTNAINIYAGINGLEAGQSVVIGCGVLVHNLIELRAGRLSENHLFSIMIMTSFVGVTFGLLRHNWYPSSVFVGDTFCYFAGMTFAVVGILGHFSKTLLLFFIPQIINFLWSAPQLFKFVPCPRHRLPRFNGTLMEASTAPCKAHEFRLLKRHADDNEVPNMTLINLVLQLVGPMNEKMLCVILLAIQAGSCAFALVCRYYIAQFFFDD